MIQHEIRDSVAVLHMEHGKVNAIDVELFTALESALQELEPLPATAVVLTGTGNAFSAGVNLFRILEEGRGYIERFLPILSSGLKKLLLFPKPVIAAVNGHAIAGGCLLACSCDYRIMSQGTIGVPELRVGVPFPALPLEIVRFVAPPQYLQEIVYTGRTYNPEEALSRGLVDEIAPPDALMERAFEMARTLGKHPSNAFRIVKQQMRMQIIETAERLSKDGEVLQSWFAPETHAVIRDYLNKTLGKSDKN